MKSYVDIDDAQRVRVKRQRGQAVPLWEGRELAGEDVGNRHLSWSNAGHEERAAAYCAYVAAANREAAAGEFLRASAPCAARGTSA